MLENLIVKQNMSIDQLIFEKANVAVWMALDAAGLTLHRNDSLTLEI